VISYAQNFEDVMLVRALGDRANGFYVDIGACFPDVASVTRHFYELGWNGVNVEPMGEPFERLQAERPRDINVRAAVASFTGEIPIYHGPSVGESSALRPFDTARPILVPCFTLADLCRRYVTRPMDFLKIDVEGLEDVVKGGDWAQYRPAVVVLEVTMPCSTQRRTDASEIGEFLRGKDYDEVYFDGLNAFFLAREAASLAPRFAAPPNVLDRFAVAREAELEAATARLQAHAESVGRPLSEIETHASAAEREFTALAVRATAAEALAQQAEALALRAEAIARDLEARRRESEAREHRAVTRALQAEDTIASMLRSHSWRVTAPLRVLADLIRGAPAPLAPARPAPLSAVRANALPNTTTDAAGERRVDFMPAEVTIEDLTSRIQQEIKRRRA
jgi:FkbM family methyltransferase